MAKKEKKDPEQDNAIVINEGDLKFCENYESVMQMVNILELCKDVLTPDGERDLKLHKQYLIEYLDKYLEILGRIERN